MINPMKLASLVFLASLGSSNIAWASSTFCGGEHGGYTYNNCSAYQANSAYGQDSPINLSCNDQLQLTGTAAGAIIVISPSEINLNYFIDVKQGTQLVASGQSSLTTRVEGQYLQIYCGQQD